LAICFTMPSASPEDRAGMPQQAKLLGM